MSTSKWVAIIGYTMDGNRLYLSEDFLRTPRKAKSYRFISELRARKYGTPVRVQA